MYKYYDATPMGFFDNSWPMVGILLLFVMVMWGWSMMYVEDGKLHDRSPRSGWPVKLASIAMGLIFGFLLVYESLAGISQLWLNYHPDTYEGWIGADTATVATVVVAPVLFGLISFYVCMFAFWLHIVTYRVRCAIAKVNTRGMETSIVVVEGEKIARRVS